MSVPSWARVGAKVVCIVGNGWFEDETGDDCNGPTEGDICTILAIDPDPIGIALIQLVEYADDGANFDVRAFRPLVTLEDDITTHFADLLDVREPVGA